MCWNTAVVDRPLPSLENLQLEVDEVQLTSCDGSSHTEGNVGSGPMGTTSNGGGEMKHSGNELI